MPDIALCRSTYCPRRQTCVRWRAYPNEHWQTYCCPDPNKCDLYVEVTEDDVRSGFVRPLQEREDSLDA
jgi:hypothetical protein